MAPVVAQPGGPLAARPAWAHPGPDPSPRETSHPALATLVDLGLLSPGQAGGTRVRDLSRAHPVWSVHLPDGRQVVVKASAPDRGPDLGIEFLVYRMAVWCAPLRQALPEAVAIDEDRHVLVLADVRSSPSAGSLAEEAGWPALVHPRAHQGMPDEGLVEASHRLGRTLGTLHRATAGLRLPPARPPLVLAGLGGLYPTTGPHMNGVEALRSDVALVEAARLMASPVAGCLVNHDMKWDNVVVTAERRTVLLDWELAGLGDPAWDLGCLLAEHLVRQSVSQGGAASLGVASDAAAGSLVAGYAEGAMPRTEIVRMLATRVVTAAALRIVQLGLEVEDTHGGGRAGSAGRGRSAALTERARLVLSEIDGLSEEVALCLQ